MGADEEKAKFRINLISWRRLAPFILALLLIILLASCGCLSANAPRKGRPQIGVASWYGKEFHGRPTSSGEIFDMYKLTAAHKELPLGTRVRVTNLKNRKSVIVKVNDRGPFVKGRIIDLAYGAAKVIGMVEDGVARVRVEIVR